MNDDDLIRRGDALAAAADLYRWSIAAGEELETALAAERAKVAKLVEALQKYGEHEGLCLVNGPCDRPCDCGLDAAITEASQ